MLAFAKFLNLNLSLFSIELSNSLSLYISFSSLFTSLLSPSIKNKNKKSLLSPCKLYNKVEEVSYIINSFFSIRKWY